MNKQMVTIVVTALIVLMAAEKLRQLPLVGQLPTF